MQRIESIDPLDFLARMRREEEEATMQLLSDLPGVDWLACFEAALKNGDHTTAVVIADVLVRKEVMSAQARTAFDTVIAAITFEAKESARPVPVPPNPRS